VLETPPRRGVWLAQTPQAFRRDWLLDAYARRAALGAAITDDAQLVEAAGYPVHLTPGSALNFKITTPADLILAEALFAAPAGGAPGGQGGGSHFFRRST
jgi:2-C-methyl-D-erythritol 4-phosphate cytidylyltransferase